ncbi:general mRNAion factor II-I repeat domain-containing protein 2-like, partial [Huso huso]
LKKITLPIAHSRFAALKEKKMEPPKKKRSIVEEGRTFQEKWSSSYFVIKNGEKALCLICKQQIPAMKEYNVKRHYETNHGSYNSLVGDQRKKKLEQLRRELSAQQSIFKNVSKASEAATRDSYVVAHEIAKRSKPFSEGEFIKHCMVKVAEIVCPEKKAAFQDISLSKMTVTRRIEDIGSDLKRQLIERTEKLGAFSIALDESTDIGDTAQLLIFIWSVSENFEISEDLLSLESLKDRSRGVDICDAVCPALDSHSLKLSSLVSVTTDGAPAMMGGKAGAVALISKKVLEDGGVDIIHYHCIIHQEAIAAHVLGMGHVMDIVIKTVNLIKSRGLNHRQFKAFLEQSEAEFGDVIYFTAVRWLSRGATLKRFFLLRKEIADFMHQKGQDLPQLSDIEWICDLAFLTDLTSLLNDLNLKLQGHGKLISSLFDSVKSFERKLQLLQGQLKEGSLAHFPACKELLEEEGKVLDHLCSDKNNQIMEKLQAEFRHRFSDFRSHEQAFDIFQDPFKCAPEGAPTEMQFELIDLQESQEAKTAFREQSLIQFYQSLSPTTYPALRQHAFQMASLFGSTYTCEKTFSTMNINKSKLRSRLTDDHLHSVLRIATTGLEPRLSEIVAGRSQHHKSHASRQ